MFALGGCGGAAHPTTTGSNPALFNREVYDYKSRLSPAAEGRRYRVIVLQATDARVAAALRRANPNLRLLVYQDIAVARATDQNGITVCTSSRSDLAAHPSWFLRGRDGRPITQGFDYLMNVGDIGYQHACLAHAVALAHRLGFDGVFMDGVGASLAFEMAPGTRPYAPALPTTDSWQSAMYSMLTYAGEQLHANRLLSIANIGGAVLTAGLWQRWSSVVDGAEEESWTDGGRGLVQQLPAWREKLANVAWSEAHGKYAILHSYSPSNAGNVYGLASMLLVANGRSSYSTSNVNDVGYEAWYPEYDVARSLGPPSGGYSILRNGVYERRFAHGIVLVNPTTRPTSRFSLGGDTYTGAGLSGVGSVAMAPVSGLILATSAP